MITRKKSWLYLTTAAALGSSAQAFVVTMPQQQSRHLYIPAKTPFPSPTTTLPLHNHPTRLHYSSNKKEDDDDDAGVLSKIGKKVKSFLPTKWFGTEKEKEAAIQRREVKKEITGSLDQVLKDAPLAVRMFGKMIIPIFSSVASSLAESMAEQQKTTEALLKDTKGYLMRDPAVTRLLGEPIVVGAPFSQSSSTTSINGKTQTRIELGLQVSGSMGSGIARVSATQEGISQLFVEAQGRRINVSLSSGGSSWSSGKTMSSKKDDNIIEAEIIDKETKY